jgi:hypothetical protein
MAPRIKKTDADDRFLPCSYTPLADREQSVAWLRSVLQPMLNQEPDLVLVALSEVFADGAVQDERDASYYPSDPRQQLERASRRRVRTAVAFGAQQLADRIESMQASEQRRVSRILFREYDYQNKRDSEHVTLECSTAEYDPETGTMPLRVKKGR